MTKKKGSKDSEGKVTGVVDSVVDVFAEVDVLDKVNKTSKSKAKDRDEISIGADLDRLAAFEVLMDSIAGCAKQLKEELVSRGYKIYADRAHDTKEHPESFVGTGEVSAASFEMRRAGWKLAEEVVKMCREHNLSVIEEVIVPERYVFNSELLADPDIRKAVGEAISSHPKLKDQKLIQKQAQEVVYKTSKEILEQAAAKLSVEEYMTVVPKITSFAVGKFKLGGQAVTVGRGDEAQVTPDAKAMAVEMLQDMGVLPESRRKGK